MKWGIVGVDPGFDGGLALLAGGRLVAAAPMPTSLRDAGRTKLTFDAETGLPLERKVKGKRDIDLTGLVDLLQGWKDTVGGQVRFTVENVGVRPAQGIASAGRFLFGAGLLRGAAAGLGMSIEAVESNTWKAAMGVTSDKKTSQALACELEPEMAALFAKEGVAEAFLIGLWGWRHGA